MLVGERLLLVEVLSQYARRLVKGVGKRCLIHPVGDTAGAAGGEGQRLLWDSHVYGVILLSRNFNLAIICACFDVRTVLGHLGVASSLLLHGFNLILGQAKLRRDLVRIHGDVKELPQLRGHILHEGHAKPPCSSLATPLGGAGATWATARLHQILGSRIFRLLFHVLLGESRLSIYAKPPPPGLSLLLRQWQDRLFRDGIQICCRLASRPIKLALRRVIVFSFLFFLFVLGRAALLCLSQDVQRHSRDVVDGQRRVVALEFEAFFHGVRVGLEHQLVGLHGSEVHVFIDRSEVHAHLWEVQAEANRRSERAPGSVTRKLDITDPSGVQVARGEGRACPGTRGIARRIQHQFRLVERDVLSPRGGHARFREPRVHLGQRVQRDATLRVEGLVEDAEVSDVQLRLRGRELSRREVDHAGAEGHLELRERLAAVRHQVVHFARIDAHHAQQEMARHAQRQGHPRIRDRLHRGRDVRLEDLRLRELLVPVRGEPDLAQRPFLGQNELRVEHPWRHRGLGRAGGSRRARARAQELSAKHKRMRRAAGKPPSKCGTGG
mmetsp:Transcript_13717/g.51151  ORF Transcript_13717/g.51151 Transcript_13717/m.51151 type:complete len:553 (-) Transcript_13717:43-1701(-)